MRWDYVMEVIIALFLSGFYLLVYFPFVDVARVFISV